MNTPMQVSVIIPAAGRSRRFNPAGGVSKIERPLHGKAVGLRAAGLFLGREDVSQVLLAVPPDQLETLRNRWADQLGFLGGRLIAGGEHERWETVRAALDEVDESATHIAVHDAARPLTSQALIDRLFAAAREHEAVVPGVPVSDTLKRVTDEARSPQGPGAADEVAGAEAGSAASAADPLDALLGGNRTSDAPPPPVRRVVETMSREGLVAVQTPQVFEASLLQRAYAVFASDDPVAGAASGPLTDDAGLVEAEGRAVHVVEGEPGNFKLTYPADAELAEAVLAQREAEAERGQKRLFAEDEDEL